MRRRRISRKKKQDRYGAITAVLLLLVVAAFIYAFQSLGIYDILFKPTLSDNTDQPGITTSGATSGTTDGPSASVSPTASTAAVSGDKVSQEIKMNSITLYGVQLGVFTKLENAQTTADKYKKEGSAGYILKEDTLYRVVDSVYYTENDAKAIRDVFRKGTCPDACCIRVQASGINWKINATQAQIDAIKGAITSLQGQIISLINAQKTAQQNSGSTADYKSVVTGASLILKNASDTMTSAVGNTSSSVIQKLNQCLTDSADSLNKLGQTDSADTAGLLSGLKYSIIDILIKLQNNVMSST
jgi:hypothetical protein